MVEGNARGLLLAKADVMSKEMPHSAHSIPPRSTVVRAGVCFPVPIPIILFLDLYFSSFSLYVARSLSFARSRHIRRARPI